jgi:secreted trypsin-like serine protease
MGSISIWMAAVAALSVTLVGCAGEDASSTTDDAEVVGGRAATGVPAVGYLATGPNAISLDGPVCGATLIGRRLAVTAAHCVEDRQAYGVGFGSVTDAFTAEIPFPARRVVAHPRYDARPNIDNRFHHDVAVVFLKDAPPIAPLEIGAAQTAEARYIGYGRTTGGGENVQKGFTGERKRATQDVTRLDAFSIFTSGIDGGLCWGDSGGPLLQGGRIVGVLADFDGDFDCHRGNAMIFTNLDGERSFIDAAMACAEDPRPAECMSFSGG